MCEKNELNNSKSGKFFRWRNHFHSFHNMNHCYMSFNRIFFLIFLCKLMSQEDTGWLKWIFQNMASTATNSNINYNQGDGWGGGGPDPRSGGGYSQEQGNFSNYGNEFNNDNSRRKSFYAQQPQTVFGLSPFLFIFLLILVIVGFVIRILYNINQRQNDWERFVKKKLVTHRQMQDYVHHIIADGDYDANENFENQFEERQNRNRNQRNNDNPNDDQEYSRGRYRQTYNYNDDSSHNDDDDTVDFGGQWNLSNNRKRR